MMMMMMMMMMVPVLFLVLDPHVPSFSQGVLGPLGRGLEPSKSHSIKCEGRRLTVPGGPVLVATGAIHLKDPQGPRCSLHCATVWLTFFGGIYVDKHGF